MRPSLLVATLCGVGRLKPAPGTWGSAAVLPAALLGPDAALVLAMAATIIGLLALRDLFAGDPDQDPDWVVVDEAAGMLLTLAALPAAAGWTGVALAFLLFRAFDILKPWPVSWADGLGGPVGVMLDDILAGAIGGAILLLLGAFAPGIL